MSCPLFYPLSQSGLALEAKIISAIVGGKQQGASYPGGMLQQRGLTLSFTQLTILSREVPGKNISLIPSFLSLGMSSSGMMPPPTTIMSSVLCSVLDKRSYNKEYLTMKPRFSVFHKLYSRFPV